MISVRLVGRAVALTVAAATACSMALEAQAAGRWRLTLTPPVGPAVQGELWLAARGPDLVGTLGLETSDSAPVPVVGRTVSPDRVTLEVQGPVPWRFDGEVQSQRMQGEATGSAPQRWTWQAVRLSESAEFYVPLPRFTLRQLVMRSRSPEAQRIPGPWLAAAAASGNTPEAMVRAYQEIAQRAGLTPLAGEQIEEQSLLRAMGLYRRQEIVAVHHAVLEAIRARLPTDTLQAHFDFLFRPDGRWQVDIHDVARARAVQHLPTATWARAVPALAVGRPLPEPPGDHVERVPWALYRLFTLSRTDPERHRELLTAMYQAEPHSARSVEALLAGYEDGLQWYGRVMEFLVSQPWFDGRWSLDVRVAQTWGDAQRPVSVVPHIFGYPEGAPMVAALPPLAARLVVPRNWSATRWLARHGHGGLRRVLESLPAGGQQPSELEVAGTIYDITAVDRVAARRPAGFLETRDQVLIDPSYMPLLALGTVVHEWHHILHEHGRLARSVATPGSREGVGSPTVVLEHPHPVIAEGLAEWLAEAALHEMAIRYPLLAVGEAEKRAALAVRRPNDPHVMGYRLMRTLAQVIPDAPALGVLVTQWGDAPAALAQDDRVASLWAPHPSAPDVAAVPVQRQAIIPEVTFTIDDNAANILATRIIVPFSGDSADVP